MAAGIQERLAAAETTQTRGAIREPNFFIVGAARSGTTSLWHSLRQHPDVFMPLKQKEPHFFCDASPPWAVKDLDAYLALFTDAEERKRYLRAFEKRLLDEEAHILYTLQWHRIIPYSSKVRGWTITPSHYLNNQLDTVWLGE